MTVQTGMFSLLKQTRGLREDILYSTKFLRVFNFTNFANFQPFAKIFQQNFLTHSVQCARAANS